MIPIETITLFLAAAIALGFTFTNTIHITFMAPGPDNIFVLTQSALHGRIAGLFVTLGLCTGLIVHTTAVALGVAVIFQTSIFAFNALKIVGALYLLYLAWQAFRTPTSEINIANEQTISLRKLYIRGVIMNISNPKVAIFFLAFLPQFADPDHGAISHQIFIFGAIFIATTLVVFSSVGWTAGFLSSWLKSSSRGQAIMNKIAGIIFVGLALKLASTER